MCNVSILFKNHPQDNKVKIACFKKKKKNNLHSDVLNITLASLQWTRKIVQV